MSWLCLILLWDFSCCASCILESCRMPSAQGGPNAGPETYMGFLEAVQPRPVSKVGRQCATKCLAEPLGQEWEDDKLGQARARRVRG
jgi:hypothetical protein